MYQLLNEQVASQRARRYEPQGVRRRSLQVALYGRRQENRRLTR